MTCAGCHRYGTTHIDNTGIVISNNTVVKVEKGATIFNAVRAPGIKITGNVAKSTGAAYFVRFHGTKNFMVSGNTVDGIKQFAYAYVMTDCDWKSSGTLSNNTVTGITENGLKAYNVGGTIRLSGEKYGLNVFGGTMLAHNTATTVTTENCTFSYPIISKIADQTYLGKTKEIKPGVTVKVGSTTLKNGTDYTVSYSNNKAVGTATAKVTGKGAYSGSATATFKIVYKKPGCSGATTMPLNSTADYSVTNGGYIRLKNSSGAYVTSNSVVSLSAPSTTVKRVTAKGVGTTTIYLLDPDGKQCGSKKVTVTKLSGKYELESAVKPGLVLDIQGGSKKDSARMIVWTRNNAPNQRYQFIAQKDGCYQIKCVHSGLAVDVKGGGTEKSSQSFSSHGRAAITRSGA